MPQFIKLNTSQLCLVQKQSFHQCIIIVSSTLLTLLVYSHAYALANLQSHADIIFVNTINQHGQQNNSDLQAKLFRKAVAAYQNGHYHLARRIFHMLAEMGVAESEFYLGVIFDAGIGVKKDPVQAVYWYKKAAKKGHGDSQHNLAVAYATGEGLDVDISKAMQWWKQSASYGNADAQYNLGVMYAMGNQVIEPDLKEAEKWWRKAAINGDAQAQYNLGIIYANSNIRVISLCEAVRWWEKSVQGGISQARHALEAIKQRVDFKPC